VGFLFLVDILAANAETLPFLLIDTQFTWFLTGLRLILLVDRRAGFLNHNIRFQLMTTTRRMQPLVFCNTRLTIICHCVVGQLAMALLLTVAECCPRPTCLCGAFLLSSKVK
jgi:hypothetical protein